MAPSERTPRIEKECEKGKDVRYGPKGMVTRRDDEMVFRWGCPCSVAKDLPWTLHVVTLNRGTTGICRSKEHKYMHSYNGII